jgi:hypothetical protein
MQAPFPAPQGHVRFGSLADICSAKGHVRFTPNSDRESEFPQKVMSALPPKADMCSALAYVRFGPIADIKIDPARLRPIRVFGHSSRGIRRRDVADNCKVFSSIDVGS